MNTLCYLFMVAGTLTMFGVPLADFVRFGSLRSSVGSATLLFPAGLLMLLVGLLSRFGDMQDIRCLGQRTVKLYKIAAILILNAVLVFACLDLVAFGILKVRALLLGEQAPTDAREKSSYYTSQEWAAQYWHEFALSRKELYHPYALWRRAPLKGKTINIDQRGIRVTPGADCGANSLKIFTFGGSPMWGTGAPDWGTIPAYLQVELEKSRRGPICVVNFGESAYVSTQSLIELLLQLQSGNVPDLVIFYDGVNDVYTGYQSGKAGVHENLEQVAARFEKRDLPQSSLLVQLLHSFSLFELSKNQVNRLRQEAQSSPKLVTYASMGIDPATLTNSIVRTYLTNYETVAALAQKYGFKYFFFWPPYISIGKKPLTTEEEELKRSVDPALEELYQLVYQSIAPLVQKYENLYYMTGIFDDYDSLLWLDETHVTPVGNQLIAHKMLQVIRQRGGL